MPGKNSLRVGDSVPKFSLNDQNGNEVNIEDFFGTGPLVIFFYPKDDTPGCIREACTFRDQYAEFKDLGATVIGISTDSPSSHRAFINKYNLPFLLLSDNSRKVRQLFGIKKDLLGLIDGRAAYVIDKSGYIVHIFHAQFKPGRHISEALRILEQLD